MQHYTLKDLIPPLVYQTLRVCPTLNFIFLIGVVRFTAVIFTFSLVTITFRNFIQRS